MRPACVLNFIWTCSLGTSRPFCLFHIAQTDKDALPPKKRSTQTLQRRQCHCIRSEHQRTHLQNHFKHLKEFCGGLATAFPGTSSVESDFSIVTWEKDDCRTSLTDMSLEGSFHSKQFDKISSIVMLL
jgi:hypothetical protein